MKNKYTLMLVACEEFIDEKKTEKFFEFLNKVAPGNEAQKTFKEDTIMFWTYELEPVEFWTMG